MTAWKFDLSNYPDHDAPAMWQDVMTRLFLPSARPLHTGPRFFGKAVRVVTPLGIEMTRLDSAPQEIAGRVIRQSEGIWVAQILEGSGILTSPDGPIALEAGDLAYGPVATDAGLTLPNNFSLFYVRLPRLALHPRLLGPTSVKVGVLARTPGIQRVFSATLRELGQSIEHLAASQLRAVELVLAELLIGSILSDAASSPGQSASGRRIAMFHRVCQTVEAELGDPELGIRKISKLQGISTRSMQKLFAVSGMSFSQYIRMRRLERSRIDLTSPLYSHLSISEICYRWGFNDAAHFSRTFRQAYDTTPRAWRNTHQSDVDARLSPSIDEEAPFLQRGVG